MDFEGKPAGDILHSRASQDSSLAVVLGEGEANKSIFKELWRLQLSSLEDSGIWRNSTHFRVFFPVG